MSRAHEKADSRRLRQTKASAAGRPQKRLERRKQRRNRGLRADESAPCGKDVVVVGAGNIGSHVMTHLARDKQIERLVLIDRDRYEPANLANQDITAAEVGKSKAAVLARRARRINPELEVVAFDADVENLPLGFLRADVLLGCLDSRRARRYLNFAAFRTGTPWVDAGVEASGLLVRVSVFLPGPDAPCYECAFEEADYTALEDSYSCSDGGTDSAPTNAPSSLGALAASLQAIECRKLLAGQSADALVGREVVMDASSHRHFLTRLRRNPGCRFDHQTWRIEPIDADPKKLSIGRVLALAPIARAVHGDLQLGVEGKEFVRLLHCRNCGRPREVPLRLVGRLRRSACECRDCGGPMMASGFDSLERLGAAGMTRSTSRRSMASFGFRRGDVFALSVGGAEAHFRFGRSPATDSHRGDRWT